MEFQISSPEPFTGKSPKDWDRWFRRFERYRIASGLVEKGKNLQVNMLLYLIGENGDDILASFALAQDDMKKYEVAEQKFCAYFNRRVKVIHERAIFNRIRQQNEESVNDYVVWLSISRPRSEFFGSCTRNDS